MAVFGSGMPPTHSYRTEYNGVVQVYVSRGNAVRHGEQVVWLPIMGIRYF